MANLSNINGKFLFTDGDFLLIGGATANSISATESGVAIKNSNAATLSLQNSATNGKNHTLWSNTDGSFNITDVGVATRFTIASGGDVYIPSGNVSIGNNSVASSGSNTILEIYSVSVPRLKLKNSTTGTAELAGSSFYLTGDDLIINNGETSGVIQFEIGGGTPIMRMKYGGNVGIGTIFPTAKLQVESTSAGAATVAAFLVNSNVTVNTETRLAFAAHTNSDIATNRYSYISTINTSGSNGQDMIFATNETGASAVERMRIDSSGFVTIKNNAGITNASLTFSNSDTGVGANQSIGYLNFYSNDASTTSTGGVGGIAVKAEEAFNTSYTPTYMSFYTHERTANDGTTLGNVTERMRITSGGNVGINDTIGYGKLAIKTSGTFTTDSNDLDFSGVNILMKTTNTATNAVGSGIVWLKGGNDSRKVAAITNYIYGDTDQSGLNFYVQETSSGSSATLSEAMRIDNSGNVGIGTTSPSKTLSVNGEIFQKTRLNLQRGSNGATTLIQFLNEVGTDRAHIDFGGTNEELSFFAGAGSSEHMRIDSSGNVGINRTSIAQPSSGATTLAIQGTSTTKGGSIRLYSSDDSVAAYIYPDNTSGLSINTSTSHPIVFRTAGTERMRITSGGAIQVKNGSTLGGEIKLTGTDNDLTINGQRGQVVFQIAGTDAYGMDSNQLYPLVDNGRNLGTSNLRWGTVYSVNGINTSDETLKENIKECDLGIDFIDSLKPKSYNLKGLKEDNDAYGKKRYGLIAQDILQTELKDSVFGEKDGEYGLSYNDLIAPMIKAIQELKAEIETLKTQINN